MIDFFIRIYNKKTKETTEENYESYYLFTQRIREIEKNKDLQILSRSNFLE